MKEIYYSWINGLWMGAKVLPKMSQFTRFSPVKSKNLALAKHLKNSTSECTLKPGWDLTKSQNIFIQRCRNILESWDERMLQQLNQLLINDLWRGAKISKTTKRISDLSVQWPGKLITFSLGGSNPEMWYVFSLRQPHCHISPKSRFPGKLYQPKIEDDWPYLGGHCHTNLLSFHHKTYIRDFFYILIKLFF